MKAFISYSHKDQAILERLHAHLANLQRQGELTSWTDEEILAGSNLDTSISNELETSDLFIALLSPDYLASNYCYEKEFQKAIEMHQAGLLRIVPIIIEPCDWKNTPFKKFKALPKDGIPVSTWANSNTAFLNIIENIRNLLTTKNNLLTNKSQKKSSAKGNSFSNTPITVRSYKVKKDFDSIEKLEFTEKSFKNLVSTLKQFIKELNALEKIKVKILKDSPNEFESLLVNRNKFSSESYLKLSFESSLSGSRNFQLNKNSLKFEINQNNRLIEKMFSLSFDDYHLFWELNNSYSFSQNNKEFTIHEMADLIWQEWLESGDISL